MVRSYMITNRNVRGDQLGGLRRQLTFYRSDQDDLGSLDAWEKLTRNQLRDSLLEETDAFPRVSEEFNEHQRHVTLFIHGYNQDWQEAVRLYRHIQRALYSGPDSMGILILFTWPSNGRVTGYLPDREDARETAPDLAPVFVQLHDHLVKMQRRAAEGGDDCLAKISVIAHSMGNYVIQKALAVASKMLNNPQEITLIHQLAMVAADVDNDLFAIDKPEMSDGSLMANLCYRIAALYNRRDAVLGASAGLKHFGKRRLGRNGLDNRAPVYDNIFEYNVTELTAGAEHPHSSVFETEGGLRLLRAVLSGVDRELLDESLLAEAS